MYLCSIVLAFIGVRAIFAQNTAIPGQTFKVECPKDNGSYYETTSGTWYQIGCAMCDGNKLGKELYTGQSLGFEDCMSKCANTPGCNSLTYGFTNNKCWLYAHQGTSNNICGGKDHHFAWAVDPPVQDAPEFPSQLCSTTCPGCDGMVHSTKYGASFKMHCGKRHATPYLGSGTAQDFDECMDQCAALVPCHSVDYHVNSGKCYYGQHQSNPTVIASGYNAAYDIGCTGACGECGGGKGGAGEVKQYAARPVAQNPFSP